MLHSYLTGRKQRVKINGSFSDWNEVSHGVPQGSVLGPLLFNIYINDLFFLVTDTEICNYADDTTIFSCGYEIDNILETLERDANLLSDWFVDNYMKMNDDKSHLLIFGNKENTSITTGQSPLMESQNEKLLGITVDKKLSFQAHIDNVCKKAGQRLHALARVSKYMNEQQLRITMTSFVTSQFSYCPLVWMCHDRKSNNKINKIHERGL